MPEAVADLPPQGDDFLVLGQNSYLNPQKLPAGSYVEGVNVMCRGGLVQTRPGSRTVFTLPDGNFQGCTMFTPDNGIPHLVFAVDGLVYVSSFPFTSYSRLRNIQFSNTAKQIAWCPCLKSSEYDEEGVFLFSENPYSVLVMQDGLTRAAFWDGANNRHLNPTVSPIIDPDSGERVTQPGYDETPLGLWMVWSNNRLWVSRGNQVFASDIGNPLKFTEGQYLNEGRAFYLPSECTGMIEAAEQQGVLAFTKGAVVFINSAQQDRSKWTDGSVIMQKTVIPNIGCVAPRSIVSQYGMIWWYSSKGLISLDDALRLNITSRLEIRDNEMYSTKYNMSYDLSGICGSYYENLLLLSVPFGDKYNRRTMVLDQAPFSNNANSWASSWEGWRPIEWARGVISGEERMFFGSVDADGKNRIWEAMTPERTDNGTPITCYFISRQHLFESRDYKQFSFAELDLKGIDGDVSILIAAKGDRGAFQRVGGAELVATQGQMYGGDIEYGFQANSFGSSTPQTRIIKSLEGGDSSKCNGACVETKLSGLVDRSFSLMVAWSGSMAVGAYRIFAHSFPNDYNGSCNEDEVGPNMLNDQGCGSKAEFNTSEPFEEYESTSQYTATNPETGLDITYTATAVSKISQRDADRRSYLMARNYVLSQIYGYN